MTYDEAITLRATLEASLLSGDIVSRSMDGSSVSYSTDGQKRAALAQVNRDIARYNQRARGANPGIVTASFNGR